MKQTQSKTLLKQSLRQKMLRERVALPAAQKQSWDTILCKKLHAWLESQKVHTVHCYLPFPEEVQYYAVIEWMLQSSIRVVCPRTLPYGEMEHRVLQNLQEIKSGAFNTRYPAASEIYTGAYDVIVVPGLAFTLKGHRLGYGGGYYDRFLSRSTFSTTLALAYPFQIVKELPHDTHDIRVEKILA